MPKNDTRQRRVGQLIQQALTLLLRNTAEDPLLRQVVITAVRVGADLTQAKVYISDMCDDVNAELEACQKAAGFLRYQLAQRIDLRTVPALTFKIDTSMSQGNKMSDLISQALAEDEQFKQQRDNDSDDATD